MKFIFLVFILWRLGLFLVAYLATKLVPFKASFPYSDTLLIPSGLPNFIWSWGNFDGVHYLTIARMGYDGFGTQVFFPLYPLLIVLLSKVTQSELLSGLLISNISILLAAVFLYKFVKREFTESVAKWTVIFLFSFPTSFFFGALYPESLLLLLILLSFYKRGAWAGIFAGLASGTKLIGAFIGPLQFLLRPRNIWGILGTTGLLVFMIHLWQKFNSPLMFLSAQSAFGNNRASDLTSLVLPPQVVYRYLKIFLTGSVQNFDYWVAVLEFIAFVFAFIVLVIITKRKLVSPKIIVFSWIALILPVFSGTFSSLPRYLLPIFPLYIFLATIKNLKIKYGVLAVFVLILFVLAALFTRGYFVS